jgi:hypothetical protein
LKTHFIGIIAPLPVKSCFELVNIAAVDVNNTLEVSNLKISSTLFRHITNAILDIQDSASN